MSEAVTGSAVTLRDQFAMAALQGMLTDSKNGDVHETEIACMAYAYADAMLEEREGSRDE